IETLRDFTRSDMAIPYNMMFDAISFARNVEDLRQQLDRAPIETLLLYQGWKLFLLQVITGSGRLDRDLPEIIAALQATGEGGDRPGLRSLTIRAAAAGHRLPSGEGDPDFGTFLKEWTDFCAGMRADVDPRGSAAALARLQSRKRQAVHAAFDLVG